MQSDPVLRHHFRLGNVITTVDAVNGARQLDAQPESVKQVAVADRLVLTKTDLADEDARKLVARLRAFNPAAPLLRTQDRIEAGMLLSEDAFGLAGKSPEARRWFAREAGLAPARMATRMATTPMPMT